MYIKGSDYVANFLSEKGIEDVFLVTGGGAMHLNDSIGHHPKLKCLYNHHEQACAMAAEAYTRYSGKIAAVNVTSGPGGTNAITGVLGGWLDSIPMFIVSGQVKRETTIWITDVPLRQLGDQEFNIVDAVRPMTKYAVMITDVKDIAYELEKAYHYATTGRGGPVWLDIPLDIQGAHFESDDLRHFDPVEAEAIAIPKVSEGTALDVARKIKEAKRPVIIAGSGIRLGNAHDEFIRLIDRLNIPVVTAWNAHDALWNEHPLYCGRPGTIGTRGGNFVVENSDLILVLGCRLNIRQISYNYRDFAKFAYKIMVDIDQGELDKPTLSIDHKIHADVKDFMEVMLQADFDSRNEQHGTWLEWCRKIDGKYPACLPEYYDTKSPINPYAFMDTLFRKLPEGETVVTGNGSACVIGFQAAYLRKGQRLFTSSGCASMGYGFPAAIGVAVEKKGGRVICLDGDGSIQMNLQELQTLVHHQFNLKLIVLNNSGYHSMRQTQKNLFSPHPLIGVSKESGVSFPDFGRLAICYGMPFVKIENIDEAGKQIEEMLRIEGPVLCEVVLDPNQNFEPKLSSKVLPDGQIVSPPLDDMFPFIDRDEYEANKRIEQ